MTIEDTTQTQGLAALVKSRTDDAHRAAESSSFMADLLDGALPEAAYIELEAQSWFIYRALEAGGRSLADDALVAPFLDDALLRLHGLEQDLEHHLGARWRESISMLPSTERYAGRIAEVVDTWPAGFIAHHYLRYLGDLSGGQIIRTKMSRAYGYDTDGVRFYVFDSIAKPKPYKDRYRAKMDALPIGGAETERFIAEVADAFRLNRDLFADLGERYVRSGAAV
ncbi:heme oxygenase (biliverdin-producing) [Tomitella fengzijianii]|uniref:Biliverdin-producing heme oxygenase n=1 Tax=Tomitella fengzijianii TaxID=2597660 RepID=A0A516X2V8_9ACTN|nr:biliverdin-producing heme oxygenase [Tomitella fengzijianii]QDQ97397.1 biliverdin-producing heme oxygenase [Tomitella fengzijianii]